MGNYRSLCQRKQTPAVEGMPSTRWLWSSGRCRTHSCAEVPLVSFFILKEIGCRLTFVTGVGLATRGLWWSFLTYILNKHPWSIYAGSASAVLTITPFLALLKITGRVVFRGLFWSHFFLIFRVRAWLLPPRNKKLERATAHSVLPSLLLSLSLSLIHLPYFSSLLVYKKKKAIFNLLVNTFL